MNLGGPASGFDGVADVIARSIEAVPPPRADWQRALDRSEQARGARQTVRSIARRFFADRQRAFLAHRSKFQGIGASRLVEKIHRAADLQRVSVEVQQLSDDLLIVRGPGS
jgi:hypothetical protein